MTECDRMRAARSQYPWLIAGLGMLCLFLSNGLTASGISVFDPSLLDAYAWPRADFKFRDVLTFWIAAALAPLVGMLLDRINPKHVLLFGMVCLAAGLYAYSALPSAPRAALLQIYAIHILFGFAVACAGGATVILLVSSWFVAHRGLALGVALLGTSLGSAVLPMINARIILEQGWREAFRVNAFAPVVFLVLVVLLVRGMPSHAGRRALGQDPGMLDLKRSGLTFSEAIRTRTFYAICVSGFLTYYCIFSFLQHVVLHMTKGLGYRLPEAASMLLLFSMLAIAAKLLSGAMADRLGRHRVFVGCLTVMLIGALALATTERTWLTTAVACIGLGWGGAFTLYNLLAVDTFGLREIGRINGVINFFESLGTGVGSWFTAILFDRYGDYRVAFAMLAIMVAVSLGTGFLVRDELRRRPAR